MVKSSTMADLWQGSQVIVASQVATQHAQALPQHVYVTNLPMMMWGLNGRYTLVPNGTYLCDRTSYWGIPLRPTRLARISRRWVMQLDDIYTAYLGNETDSPVGAWPGSQSPIVHAQPPPFWKTL